jgi:hypothetical protein
MRPSALRSRSPLDPTAEEEDEDDHDDEENKALTKDLVASLRDTVCSLGKLLYIFYSLLLRHPEFRAFGVEDIYDIFDSRLTLLSLSLLYMYVCNNNATIAGSVRLRERVWDFTRLRVVAAAREAAATTTSQQH